MELLRCPFCGNDNLDKYHNPMLKISKIVCQNCDYGVEFDKWNTRHSPWISIKDRLPEKNQHVIAFVESYNRGFTAHYSKRTSEEELYFNIEYVGNSKEDKVTHWMLLPQPPKETE